MVKEYKYTTINRVLDELHDEALMGDITLEQAVRYTIRFIGKNGQPKLFQDKIADVEIHDFRGALPCDLISIKQVKDLHSGICLRSMTDTFPTGMGGSMPTPPPHTSVYIPPMAPPMGELSFKTQNTIIYTSFPEGEVEISYRAIPVDEHGYPLLIDNEVYLDALQAYIEMRVLRNKFRKGDIPAGVYQDAQQEYFFLANKLNSEFVIPSPSEMESIARLWNTLIPKAREFDNGFKDLGSREYLRNH